MNKFVGKAQNVIYANSKLNLLAFAFSTFIYIYFVFLNH
jgi:hypothetical protein